MATGYCSVVDVNCRAPAGIQTGLGSSPCDPGPVGECVHCGEPVCVECSAIVVDPFIKKPRRWCADCIYQDGTERAYHAYLRRLETPA